MNIDKYPVTKQRALKKSGREVAPQFNFKLYGLLAAGLVAIASLLNWLVDPLWYGQGNRLTHQNFAFNERIAKTNLFLRTQPQSYDCIILGSSRVTALNASLFRDRCFNYSFKGGEIRDFIAYAKFVKAQGLNPKRVYVGVDDFNMVQRPELHKSSQDIAVTPTDSFYHAYVSADVLFFSLMTLAGISPDPSNYYDQKFEPAEFTHAHRYTPTFFTLPPQSCDLSKVALYRELRAVFPDADYVGYVPPRAAASVVNETYGRGLLDCVLEAFHQVATDYGTMYDFSIPSSITQDPQNTYDGSHFTPAANAHVAAVLQGSPMDFGINVNQYSLPDYRQHYKERLREYLQQVGQSQLWRG